MEAVFNDEALSTCLRTGKGAKGQGKSNTFKARPSLDKHASDVILSKLAIYEDLYFA